MDRPTDPDAGEIRWLSYEELGKARGISTASATRLAFRRRWRRQRGNDGTARVAVPVTELAPRQTERRGVDGVRPEGGGDALAMLRAARAWLLASREARERAEQELAQERELRLTAEAERERAEAEAAALRDRLDVLQAERAALQEAAAGLRAEAARLRLAQEEASGEAARLAERLVAAQLAARALAEAEAKLERLRRRGLMARLLNREA